MAFPHKIRMMGITVTSTMLLFGCTPTATDPAGTEPADDTAVVTEVTKNQDESAWAVPSPVTKEPTYAQIDQETARQMMATDDGHVIVDVRRQGEYDAGHIPGAILIPNEDIAMEHPEELPDTKQIILVYCRSGRRSKEAAQKLADMGYENVYEFGGIIDWTGEVVTGDDAG